MDETPRTFRTSSEPEEEPGASGQPLEWDDEPGVFEAPDPELEAAADARAEADIAAGRYHDHAIVSQWLKTWGTPDRRSFHDWLTQAKP